jgi:hypothetical protein
MDPNRTMILDPSHPSMLLKGLSSLPPSDRMQEHIYKLLSSYDGKMYKTDPYVGSPRPKSIITARKWYENHRKRPSLRRSVTVRRKTAK